MKNVLLSAHVKTLSIQLGLAVLLGAPSLAPLKAAAANQPAPIGKMQTLPDFSHLVDQSGPAVVNIRTVQKVQVDPKQAAEEAELFERYFGIPNPHAKNPEQKNPEFDSQDEEEKISRGVGSGFIVSPDGYLLSNAHVVKDADEIFVTLTDKREFTARLVGVDINTDIALLKIEGNNLPSVTIGDSGKINVGEWVIAIGSPFDLDNSISAGIISAKAREIGDFLLLIQTDVAINPGNSGGPLINMNGQVIGINSQIYSRSGGYMGISFAIPINDAMRVAEQLKTKGYVSRGRMGIYLADVSNDVAKALQLPNATGTLVSRIEPNGPAQKAGLKDGDIILKFNGTQVSKSAELRRLAAATTPGSKVDLTLWRKGEVRQWPLVLAELAASEANKKSKRDDADNQLKSPPKNQNLGLEVAPLNDEQKINLGISSGVSVARAEGRAARAGLEAEDVILAINNQDIKNQQDFSAAIARSDKKAPLVLLARREDVTQYIAIPAQ
jgi:serine protease Do